MIALGKTFMRTMLADVIASQWAGCKVDLYQNDITPGLDSAIGDFTICDFSNYVQASVPAWQVPYSRQDGTAESNGATITWLHNGGVVANIVYGYILRTAGGAYIGGGRLDAPVSMASLGDAIALVPQLACIRTAMESFAEIQGP